MHINMPLYIFIPLSVGLVIFTYAFFKWPKYAVAGLIIAKPIIDTTQDYFIISDINFLKIYAGLFVLLSLTYIIIKQIQILPSFNMKNFSFSNYSSSTLFQQSITILWLLLIISTFGSVFLITSIHYPIIVRLKYILSVANGFMIFILCKNIFDFDKDKKFFINTFIIAGIFPILLWLIPIIFNTQIYSNDYLMRVKGPYHSFWQFAFVGLQTTIVSFAWLSFPEFHNRNKFKLHISLFIIVILIFVISTIMIFRSYSKAFWIAGFLVLVIGFILQRKYILAFFLPVIITVFFLLPQLNRDINKTFENEINYFIHHTSPEQNIFRGRIIIWNKSLNKYLSLPFTQKIIGMGITHKRFIDGYIENDFIRILLEQGIVGLLTYLSMLIMLIIVLTHKYYNTNDPIAFISVLSILALFILSTGANILYIPNVLWLVWGSAGFALSKK